MTTWQGTSFARVVVVLAAAVIVLAGMYVAAGPILNPIFFALVLALIFSPVYGCGAVFRPCWRC